MMVLLSQVNGFSFLDKKKENVSKVFLIFYSFLEKKSWVKLLLVPSNVLIYVTANMFVLFHDFF